VGIILVVAIRPGSGVTKGVFDEDDIVVTNDKFVTTYDTILDLIRNKPKLELAYYNTVIQSIKFCGAYERKQEIKRTGELLRSHFSQLVTHGAGNSSMISIDSIKTSQNSLNYLYGARFEYLNCVKCVRIELVSQIQTVYFLRLVK